MDFFLGWLLGSGAGDELIEGAENFVSASFEMSCEVFDYVSSTPWLFIPVLIAIIAIGIGVVRRCIYDDKDNGRG